MIYSQNDPAWKNTLLGFNTSTKYTIGTAGCFVTANSNVCNWAGNDINPANMNQICKDRGWFVDGGVLARSDIPALLCSNLTYVGRKYWTGPTDMSYFADASDPNVAYIIEIDASAAPGKQPHFVMVWAKSGTADLIIDDSWDGVRKKLSAYGKPSAVIYSAMKFVKAVPAPAPAPPQVVVPVPAPVINDPLPPTQPEIPNVPQVPPVPTQPETPPVAEAPTPELPPAPQTGAPQPEVPKPTKVKESNVSKRSLLELCKSFLRFVYFGLLGLVATFLASIALDPSLATTNVTLLGVTLPVGAYVVAGVGYAAKAIDLYIKKNENLTLKGIAPKFLQK